MSLVRVGTGACRVAGNVELAGFSPGHVGAELELADAVARAQGAIALVAVVAVGEVAAQAQARHDDVRQAVVDDVDDAGRRGAAIDQRRRALDDLDLVGVERVDRHRVVGADRRGVHRGDAVLQQQHARAALAADHRPADARAEAGIGDAGAVGEHVADGAATAAFERLAAEDVDRLDKLIGRSLERAGADDDFLEFYGFFRGWRLAVSQCGQCGCEQRARNADANRGIHHGSWNRARAARARADSRRNAARRNIAAARSESGRQRVTAGGPRIRVW